MGIFPLEYPMDVSTEALNVGMRMLKPYGDVE